MIGRTAVTLRAIVLLAGIALLAGCGGGGSGQGGYHRSPSAGPLPGEGGYYKIGKPYEIDGVTYTPAVDYNYDETGIASWYGPGFHGLRTANGENYDMNQVTGAHKTLPMPSLVRVTNLDNGRSIVVRVNDRGPYVRGRIIDMSRRGAQLLGYEKIGTAKVRVQIMARESQVLAAAAKQGQLTVDIAGIDPNEPPPLPPSTPTYTRPGATPLPPPSEAGAPPPSMQYAQAETPAAVPVVDEKSLLQQQLPPQQVKGQDVGGLYLPPPVATYQKVRPTAIYVQAGSFGVADNAQRMLAKVRGVGKAEIQQAIVDGKTFYRVRVGPLANVDQADATLARVVGAGADGAKIVVD